MPPLIPGPQADVLPTTDEAFGSFCTVFAAEYVANPFDLDAVFPPAAITSSASAFNLALANASDPSTRTAVTVALKNDARAATSALIRPVIRGLVSLYRAGSVTGSQLEAFGIRIPDITPSRIEAPATVPVLGVIASVPGTTRLRLYDSGLGADTRKKPYGVVGCEIYRGYGPSMPGNGEGLGFVAVATRTPYTITNEVAQQGETMYLFGRWINTRGERGPWSLGVSVIST